MTLNLEISAPSGAWDGGRGYEKSSGAVERAKRVAGWLRTSASEEVGENGIIMSKSQPPLPPYIHTFFPPFM